MKVFLEELLPRAFPTLDFLCVAHEGKNDLEKSLRRKLPAWSIPDDKFVIIRDNDGGDCQALKKRLNEIVQEAKREALVRIACQELESWYLGDFDAIVRAYGHKEIKKLAGKEKFRNPDRLGSPSSELTKIVPSFQKVAGARIMGKHLEPGHNTSRSFQVLIEGIQAQT